MNCSWRATVEPVARRARRADTGPVSNAFPVGLRCEHDRVVLAWHDSTLGGETRLCAGDAWVAGYIQHGWPPVMPSNDKGPRRWFGLGPRRDLNPFRQVFTGEPYPGLPVECECACGCPWHGAWGEVSAEEGVLRCPDCQTQGHPPVGRWAATR
jgi:hypothetical protein